MPTLYVLTTSKSQAVYDEIFQNLLELEPKLNPTDVMIDFEMAVIKSIQANFPEAAVHGCFFHFGQSIWRHLQSVGLQTVYTNDEDFAVQIRMLIALAFIPIPFVIEAYEQLVGTEFYSEERDSEHKEAIQNLLAYFQSTYLYRISRNGSKQKPLFDIPLWNVYENTLMGEYGDFIFFGI